MKAAPYMPIPSPASLRKGSRQYEKQPPTPTYPAILVKTAVKIRAAEIKQGFDLQLLTWGYASVPPCMTPGRLLYPERQDQRLHQAGLDFQSNSQHRGEQGSDLCFCLATLSWRVQREWRSQMRRQLQQLGTVYFAPQGCA